MKWLSVVIPVLNEADNLPLAVAALRKHRLEQTNLQIIVVDGGSTDGTPQVARSLNVELIECPDAPRGKYFLLNQGGAAAEHDNILFLDADTIVPDKYDYYIFEALNNSQIVGGAFEFTLDGPQFGLRVVEVINRLRYRIWKRYYGDQGIFVRAEAFRQVRGFPNIALMEASDFCVRLARIGQLKLIKQPILTSARRFLDNGIYRVLGFDIKMWWLNLVGKDTESYAREYWSVPKHENV